VIAADREAAVGNLVPYPADPVEGQLGVDLVNRLHQGEVALGGGHRSVVDARARKTEQARLTGDRQAMTPIDHRFALVP